MIAPGLLLLTYDPSCGSWGAVIDQLVGQSLPPPRVPPAITAHALVVLGDRMECFGYTIHPHAGGGWVCRSESTTTICGTLEALETFVDQCSEVSKVEARRRYANARYAAQKKRPDERATELKGAFMDALALALARALAMITARQTGSAS